MQLPYDSPCKHYHIGLDINMVENKYSETEAEDKILLTAAKPIRVYD